MDKKKRHKKGGNKNAQNHAPEPPESPGRTSTFDTRGLSPELAKCFMDADNLIQGQFNTLKKQEGFIPAIKDQMLREIDACFDKVIQIATRRKQLLRGEVTDIYSTQLEELQEKKENVLLAGMFLETLLRQTRDMATVPAQERMGFEHMVHREIDRHRKTALEAIPHKNLMDFDKTVEVLEPLERKLRMVGKVKAENDLPATAVLRNSKAIAGLSSTCDIQILDGAGEIVPPNLVRFGRVSLELRDQQGEFVQYQLENKGDDSVMISFKPVAAELHKLTVQFCGHTLKQLDIEVQNNLPSLLLGPTEGLIQPNALCSLKDGRVCVADSGAGKLMLFGFDGKLIADATFADSGFVPFDVTSDLKRNYIICTGSQFDDQDDTLSASPEDEECSFPPEMSEDAKDAEPYPVESSQSSHAWTSKNLLPKDNDHIIPDTKDLKILETRMVNVCVKYIEKQGYITLTARNQIILGEVNSNKVLVYDIEGHFLRVISSPSLDCLGSVQCNMDGQVIVSDVGHCVLLAGVPESGLCERIGSVETESKQLLLPLGLALDETGNLVVADGGGPRIFIYGEYGEFVSHMQLAPPADDLETEGAAAAAASPSKSPKVSVIPWALTVSGGHVWVIDNNSHKVLRYSYSTPS